MASYRILIKPSAARELEAVPLRDRQRIARRVQVLSENPRPPGVEKLSADDRYRVRQGSYRVVYSISDEGGSILIVKIGHRREVYR